MTSPLRQIAKGSGANTLFLASKIAEQLLLIPILLASWSVELYGEWLLISAVPTYFAMSDLGFLTAGSNELARRASVETEDDVKQFFRDYTATFTRWSLFLVGGCILASFVVSLHDWLGLEIVSERETDLVFLYLIASALVSMNNTALVAGLRVRRRFHTGILIRAVSAFIRIFVVFVIVSFFDASLVGVAFLTFVMRLLEYLVFVVILRKLDLVPLLSVFHKNQEKLTPYVLIGLEFMLLPLAYALMLQGTIILVGTVVGTTAVTVFNTHRTLTRMATTMLQIFVRPLQAEVGLMQKQEDAPALRRLLNLLSRVTFWMSMIIALLLVVFGKWIFEIWTHGNIEFSRVLFTILIMAAVVEGLWRIASTIRIGSNRHRPIAWGFLIFSCLGLWLAFGLGKVFGLDGIAFAMLITQVVTCIFVIWVTVKLLDMTSGSYVLNLMIPPVREIRHVFSRAIRRMWG